MFRASLCISRGQPLTFTLGVNRFSSTSMPYFFILGGFLLFSCGALAVMLLTWLYSPIRPAFPFIWRAWLWGTIGFIVANAVFVGVIVLILGGPGPLFSAPSHHEIIGIAVAVIAVVGPFVASGLGLMCGVLFGCYLAWCVVTGHRLTSRSSGPPSAAAELLR